MNKVLKVVNLSKNHILSAGMKGIFSKTEKITFLNQSLDDSNILSTIVDADVIIIEKKYMTHPILKEIKEKNNSLIFYLDLEENKVNLVQKKHYDLNCVEDLVHLVLANGESN